ncbi:MAG: hypothetical protein NC432_12425 [Roseburia sp.]|nr:hypothetical protein [Roseburia sp.]MCM1096481.1 hypothetical protein [Ruminococcus flavefaciens]
MRRFGKLAAVGAALALLLSGCGQARLPESVSATTLAVDADGGLTYYLVEEFGREYYDLAELAAMAKEETESFRGAEGGVSLEKVERTENAPDQVSLVYRFEKGESFSKFTGSSFFFGTVSEALELGYDPGEGLRSLRDGAVQNREQLAQNGEKRLIITDARALIYCPAGIAALKGAELAEDGSVDASGAEEAVWILLK